MIERSLSFFPADPLQTTADPAHGGDREGHHLDPMVVESSYPASGELVTLAGGIEAMAPLVGGPTGRAVFLDVETTGLNPGAGTLVILVGLGFWDQHHFVVRQYLLNDPAVEPAMLRAVAETLAGFDVLVTFNGKRFDLPLLLGRYHLHRLGAPSLSQHLDVLPIARQVWHRRLGRSNLATLETRVLGVIRERDVPGEEIPRRYFAFLHDRRPEAMAPVLEHNRQDVVSLARLSGRLEQLLRGVINPADLGPADLLGLAALQQRLGQGERATRCYEAALIGATPSERVEALFHLATVARKQQELDRAIQLLEAVSRYSTWTAVLGAIELAKICEHQLKQPALALDYARRALATMTSLRRSPASALQREIVRRIERLEGQLPASKRAAPARTE